MDRRGFSLLELLITIAVSGIVLAAVLGVTDGQRRFYRYAAAVSGAMDLLARTESAMQADLLPLNVAAGDLLYAGADSLRIRAFRGAFAVCSPPVAGDPARLQVRRLTAGGTPTAGDSALVFDQGAGPDPDDDGWTPIAVSAVTTATCPDGGSGWELEVAAAPGVDAIPVGAPLRRFRPASYWFAPRAEGWHLLSDAHSGQASSLAGPLVAASEPSPGLRFRYLDADGGTATATTAVRLEIVATARPERTATAGGVLYEAVRTISITPRNR